MTFRRPRSIAATAALAILGVLPCEAVATTPEGPAGRAAFIPEVRWREPVAIVSSNDGNWLYVANRASGSISVIDAGRSCVVAEVEVGGAISGLAATPDGRFLLAIDETKGRVELLAVEGAEVVVVGGTEVAAAPVGVAIAADGGRAYVASLWPKCVSVIDLEIGEGGTPRLIVAGDVALPFEPRCVLAAEGGKVVVADAFGGNLAVIDGEGLAVDSVRELPAHNIRGLALSADGDRLLLAHQTMNRAGRSDLNDVHWAAFITSDLRALPMSAVLDPAADPVAEGTRYHLSDVGDGGADPNGVLALPDGRIAVALGGVNEVAFGPEGSTIGHRVPVGRRPIALAMAKGSDRVYVIDAFDDTVSVVALEDGARPVTIPLGPHPEPDTVRRGREQFHDASLSHDGWMSCHSCHADGHANGQLVDTLGDDSYGTPKRTLSLLGVGETGPWAWDGSMATIGDQIRKSVVSTMRGYPLDYDQVDAIEAYLRSLLPPPALEDGRGDVDGEAIARGSATFRSLRCDRCHTPPTFTSPASYDVGFQDERGRTEFNPPSLRGVGRRRLLFHDGRAGSLPAVFEQFEHQLDAPLAPGELADLVAFLRSL